MIDFGSMLLGWEWLMEWQDFGSLFIYEFFQSNFPNINLNSKKNIKTNCL